VNVDVLSICKSMIKKGNESSVKVLAELVLSRQGIGREVGGTCMSSLE
jgi:hypothetical protein